MNENNKSLKEELQRVHTDLTSVVQEHLVRGSEHFSYHGPVFEALAALRKAIEGEPGLVVPIG